MRLDSRKTPSPGKFNLKSGIDLKLYLKRFETYCTNNFTGDTHFWIAELENHLEGNILTALQALRTYDDTFVTIKRKLIEYYKDVKTEQKNKQRQAFSKMQYIKGESIYFLTARLEKQYRLAYPRHNVSSSQTLQEKFATLLPKTLRSMWKAQVMERKMKNSKPSWKTVQRWAKVVDAEQADDSNEHSEIVIEVGRKIHNTQYVDEQPRHGSQHNRGDQQHGSQPRHGNRPSHGSQPHRDSQPHRGSPRHNDRRHRSNEDRRSPQPSPTRDHDSANNRRSVNTCDYCNREGHRYENCRKRLRLCLHCGSDDHFVKDCPRITRRRSNDRNGSNPRPHTQQTLNTRPLA